MQSKWKLLFVLGCLLLLFGCGGGGGSDKPTPPPVDSGTTTTLTTTLSLAGAQPSAATVRTAAVQAATVTLTLPDGTTYIMADNGSGGYSCTVKNFPTGSPFVIDAHAGDLVLKNFFDGLQTADGAIDLGETNPKTTLFVDLLATFAGALDANLNFPTAQNLLQAVQNATLEIDLITLKEQVNDDNDPVFAQVRQTYQSVLSWSNLNGGTSSEALIAEEGTLTTVVSEIATGGMLPPVAGSDVDAVRPLLSQLYLAYLKGDAAALAAVLGSEGFLWSGQNAAEFLAGMEADEEFGALAGITDLTVIRAGGTVEPGPEPDSWWLYGNGEFTYTLGGIPHWFQFDDKKQAFEGLALLVKKDALGRFAIYGDQRKTETWGEIEYVREENYRSCSGSGESLSCQVIQNGSTWIGFGAGIAETTGYPVSSAALSGSAFTQSFTLVNHPGDDSNERRFWGQYKWNGSLTSNVGIYNESTGQWESSPITWTAPLEGAKLNVEIAFADGATETRAFVVPPAVTPVYPRITGITGNADGTVTVNWTDISGSMPGGAGLAEIEVEIIDDTQAGWYEIMGLDELAPSTGTVTLPAGQLVPGQVYLARVSYEDIYGRAFESRSYFVAPTPTLPFTDALLSGKSFRTTWDNLATEGERGVETYTFAGSGGQYTISYVELVYNAGDELIATNTTSFTGSILSDDTFRVEFPQPDQENGATYSILTLLDETGSTMTFRYVDYTPANAPVDSDVEVWTKL